VEIFLSDRLTDRSRFVLSITAAVLLLTLSVTNTAITTASTNVILCVCSVLNCVRLLTRILAYIFEDPDWRGFFWSTLPRQTAEESAEVHVYLVVFVVIVAAELAELDVYTMS